jgi:broad specificity phosphatase PhoE
VELAVLARHGESAYSVRAAVNGDPRISVPLTREGELQARRLGELLADEPIDLCVASEFERCRRTAELALTGRSVPLVVMPELNDPRAGDFEGSDLETYRAWAHAHGPLAEPPGGGESRAAVAERLARGYRLLLECPEAHVLVVGHSLPIAYALNAARGRDPTARVELLGYGEPHRLSAEELAAAADRLERWAAKPSF